MANKFKLSEVKSRFESFKKAVPKVLAVETKNQFLDNFRNEGYDGKKWQEVKRRIPGTPEYEYPKNKGTQRRTKKILSGTGKLKNSIHIVEATFDKVLIATGSEAPYAQIQNEGGVINKGASQRVINFRNTDNDWDKKTGKYKQGTKFSKAKKATHSMKVNIAAHSIKIPSRPFMNHTARLRLKQMVVLREQFRKIVIKK